MAERLNDFLSREFPPISMVVGRGILPRKGKLFIGGAPKIGKSFLVLNMALDMAAGRPLFNAHYPSGKPVFPVYKQNRVLYMENEIGELKLQERFRNLVAANGLDAAELKLFIRSRDMRMRLDTDTGYEFIKGEIQEAKPDVVILDPLTQFHLSDENSSQEMSKVLRAADHFIEDFGVSIIYIHHTGHQNPEFPRSGGAKLRGSTAIFGAADAVMLIDRESAASSQQPYYKVTFDLRHDEPLEPMHLQKLSNGSIRYESCDVHFDKPHSKKGNYEQFSDKL